MVAAARAVERLCSPGLGDSYTLHMPTSAINAHPCCPCALVPAVVIAPPPPPFNSAGALGQGMRSPASARAGKRTGAIAAPRRWGGVRG